MKQVYHGAENWRELHHLDLKKSGLPPYSPAGAPDWMQRAAEEIVAFGQPTVQEALSILSRHAPAREDTDKLVNNLRNVVNRVREFSEHPEVQRLMFDSTVSLESALRKAEQLLAAMKEAK